MMFARKYLLLIGLAVLWRAEATEGRAPLSETPGEVSGAFLVKQGRPTSVILVPKTNDTFTRDHAEYFVKIVAEATGAEIPIVTEGSDADISPETLRIFINCPAEAEKAGLPVDALPEEGFQIIRRENKLFILGKETPRRDPMRPVSQPVRWALNRILEQSLGVRWLWPGELGTYVPKHPNLPTPSEDITYQPQLVIRSLRLSLRGYEKNPNSKLVQEAVEWAENHQAGRRGPIRLGHAFIDWWEKYGKSNPEFFAETPDGIEQPFLGPNYVKLRISNPAVIAKIVEEYREAGAPQYWNVSPNDRYGFDLSSETRNWDIPQDLPLAKIWGGEANLTPRYVKFWNLIYEELQKINPDVVLATYAYYSYFRPPPAERPLTAKCVVGVVSGYTAFDIWKGWAETGSELILRPNWWHLGADAPHIPNTEIADYLKFAWNNGMIGLDMDSILGYWSTQGINYYLVARLMTRPDLTKDDILAEYLSAFGKGAPFVREYFSHFEKVTRQYDYPGDDGQLVRLVGEGKVENRWTKGGHQALPYLWNDHVLNPGYALLKQADEAIGDPTSQEARRVEFLRNGLDHLRAKRELMATSAKAKKDPSPKNLQSFNNAARALSELRETLGGQHCIWPKSAEFSEDGHRVFVRKYNEASDLLPEEM